METQEHKKTEVISLGENPKKCYNCGKEIGFYKNRHGKLLLVNAQYNKKSGSWFMRVNIGNHNNYIPYHVCSKIDLEINEIKGNYYSEKSKEELKAIVERIEKEYNKLSEIDKKRTKEIHQEEINKINNLIEVKD